MQLLGEVEKVKRAYLPFIVEWLIVLRAGINHNKVKTVIRIFLNEWVMRGSMI